MATLSCRFRIRTKISFGKFWGGPGGPEYCLIYPVYNGYISRYPGLDEASATVPPLPLHVRTSFCESLWAGRIVSGTSPKGQETLS